MAGENESTPVPPAEPDPSHSLPFPVVGVGASAGGMEAFSRILELMPADCGMAFILVLHLDPHHESLVANILGRVAQIPVHEAVDGMAVEMNHVYVIPPNAVVALTDGHLQVRQRPAIRAPHMPVDHLFRSLATVQRDRAIGVILSGNGSDGTLAIQEIRAEEGVTFAQDQNSAKYDSMPRSAVGTGCIDFVLPPEEIAQELLRLTRRDKVTTPEMPTEEKDSLPRLFTLLSTANGIDFTHYKRTTISRRIRRRMSLLGIENIADYVRELEGNTNEVQALYQDFLIRVTSFFRDPLAFQALQTDVFRRLLQDRPSDTPIRIWVAGCSTGEEVYSIAISLIEFLGDMATSTPVKILATDVSETALEKARAGVYLENIELDLSPERLRRYFAKVNGHYQIIKSIRDMCVFARHNLVRDPPFSQLDLVSCRNVLIYLDLALQKRILPLFHYALKPSGYVMLGSSETIGSFGDLFEPVNEKQKIYRRKTSSPLMMSFDFDVGVKGIEHRARGIAGAGAKRGNSITHLDVQKEADRLVIHRYGPAGVVVDEDLNILHFRGQTGRYLEHGPGTANLNLLRMAREGLLVELRKAVAQAKAEAAPVRREGLVVKHGEQYHLTNLEIIPMRVATGTPGCLLILFEEATPEPPSPEALSHLESIQATKLSEQRSTQLQQELDATREYLQSVIEEHEATNEELKCAHEEILSSNEELQSTNEELQTAKEEMQSANEELATVNEELRHRNAELAKLNDDLVNLFTGVSLPIVMVGRNLHIRRLTPMAEKVFNLIPSDVGRSISDIRSNLDVPNLDKHITEVIETLTLKELEARDKDGKWYSVRIRPYITLENKIDGASIAALDIDALKRGVEQLERARDTADAIINTVRQPLVVIDRSLRVLRANAAFFGLVGVGASDVTGRPFPQIGQRQWDQPELLRLIGEALGGGNAFHDLELKADFPGSGPRELLLHGTPIVGRLPGELPVVLLAIEDVTERRRELRQARLLAEEPSARASAESSKRAKDG